MKKDGIINLIEGWQEIVNLIAKLSNVPAVLIMKLNEEELEVFVSSDTDNNPYTVGDTEVMHNSGLYCEKVINSDAVLKVPNALKDKDWENNPDIKLNMISYLGCPIHWPDKTPFGTICILDNKENNYNEEITLLIVKFSQFIEMHLELLDKNNKLIELSEIDPLTKALNRRSFLERTGVEIERAIRYKRSFNIVMLDIDYFKNINDLYGHQFGDKVLIYFVNEIKKKLRAVDFIGRYGGEEFIVLLPETTYEEAKKFTLRLIEYIRSLEFQYNSTTISVTTSAGVGEWDVNENITSVIQKADKALYKAKETGRDRVC